MAKLSDVMTTQVCTVTSDTPVVEVARLMRDQDIGDVLITNRDGTLRGIVTDRDIVVRGVAANLDASTARVGDICTDDLIKVEATCTVEEAVKIMRDRAIRRVPVVADGLPIGIVSIGDLARVQDPRSALAEISAAAPNN